ncbi:MAG: hypothetical protein ACI9CD_001069 [Candidatus Deianiraeaceae bacterium]|jgi:hypothetical protein
MSKIVIDVEKPFHDAVKIEAIKHGQSMKDFIVNSMQKVINGEVVEKDFAKELKTSMKANNSILEELANK